MTVKKESITATAQEIDGEFVVRKGSQARATWVGADNHSYRKLQDQLEKSAVLANSADGRAMVFTRDYPFAASSAAAAVVAGRPSNGRINWKMQGSSRTFGEWQIRGVDPD